MIEPEEVEIPGDLDDMSPTFKLFSLQSGFMKLLEDNKKIPGMLLDLQLKGDQKFLRDNITCHVEEMMEMHEVFESMNKAAGMGDYKEIKPLCRDFNLEQADAMHFWIELFILLGIGPTDLKSYYLMLGEHKGIPFSQDEDPLAMSLKYSEYLLNSWLGPQLQMIKRRSFSQSTERIHWPAKDLYDGGTLIGEDFQVFSEKYLFKVSYYLYLAMGLLKGKYWREEEIPANKEKVEEYIMEAWIWYNNYLNIHTFSIEGILKTYYRKNQINIDRQINGW